MSKPITKIRRKPVMTKEKFDALPVEKQRVLLAKEVLLMLDAEKLIAERGDYFKFEHAGLFGAGMADSIKKHPNYFSECVTTSAQRNVQDILKTKGERCYVCAQGGLVMAFIAKFNEVTVGELSSDLPQVRKIFGKQFWNDLECIFERWDKDSPDDDDEALRALMKKIIRDKGKPFTEL